MNFDYNFPLPYETLLHIFSFLEEKDRIIKSRTCRAFYKISHDACFLRTFGPGLIEALGGRDAVQKLPKKSVDHWDDLKSITAAGIPHPIMRAHFAALNVDVLFIRFNNRHAQTSPDVALLDDTIYLAICPKATLDICCHPASFPDVDVRYAVLALDSVTEKYIQDSLDTLMANRTTIVVAHRLSTLSKMDRILVFDEGKVIEQGSHQEHLNKKGHYARCRPEASFPIVPSPSKLR